jgi:flagellar hook-associated protein 1 FlgK
MMNLESYFDVEKNGLSKAFNATVNALNVVNVNASSIQSRNQFLYEVNNLVSAFNNLDQQLRQEQGLVNQSLYQNINSVNEITAELASINVQIQTATNTDRLDLLDERAQLINQLSSYLGIQTEVDGNSVLHVTLANGTPLVLAGSSFSLMATPDTSILGQLDISITIGDLDIPIDNLITTGQIAGNKNYQTNSLNVAQNSLQQLTKSFADSLNQLNSLGIDTFGNLGTDIIKYTTNPDTGGAYDLSVLINDSNYLAFGFPVVAGWGPSNTGNGKISLTSMTDTSVSMFSTPLELAPPLTIEFLDSSHYQLVNATDGSIIESPITYDATTGAELFPSPSGFDPGFRVQLSNDISGGDTFTLRYNVNGIGDNRNGIAMAKFFQNGPVNGQSLSMSQAYQTINNVLATQANIGINQVESNQILSMQAQARRDQISGVSLQEETVNMTRYQQAYQASAQIIDTAMKVFDTLINIVRS